jgi:gliding motility-associated-like protein
MADTATFVTGQPSSGASDTWLYFTATAGPCTVMDSVWVEVQSYLGMPTAFTPNGDGINDLFRPAGLQNFEKVFKFEIYNRFGQLVYNDAANPQWDGTLNGVAQPRDVYIYVFEYSTDTGEVILVRGEFTLLR